MENEAKSWLASKTVWASLLQVVVGVALSTGALTEPAGTAILTSGPDLIVGFVTTILGGVSLFGRIVAKQPLK